MSVKSSASKLAHYYGFKSYILYKLLIDKDLDKIILDNFFNDCDDFNIPNSIDEINTKLSPIRKSFSTIKSLLNE